MGRVASSVDNGLMESFWSTMQRELLDRQHWTSRADLGSAIFEWIEAFYNPAGGIRRRATCPRSGSRSFTPPRSPRHDRHTRRVRRTGSGSQVRAGSSDRLTLVIVGRRGWFVGRRLVASRRGGGRRTPPTGLVPARRRAYMRAAHPRTPCLLREGQVTSPPGRKTEYDLSLTRRIDALGAWPSLPDI
jgi:hypothetical protein